MTGIYPGSFDPVTNGHLDIIERASKLCDTLIVAVLNNSAKTPLFTLDERLELLTKSTEGMKNIRITSFEGLLMDFARQQQARFVVRGLRALSDFEAELAMASMNKRLASEIETVFLMTSTQHSYLSSSMIKEIARYKKDVGAFVPPCVAQAIVTKY